LLTFQNLVHYVKASGLYQGENFDLVMDEEVLELSNHLYNYFMNPNKIIEIELRPAIDRTDR